MAHIVAIAPIRDDPRGHGRVVRAQELGRLPFRDGLVPRSPPRRRRPRCPPRAGKRLLRHSHDRRQRRIVVDEQPAEQGRHVLVVRRRRASRATGAAGRPSPRRPGTPSPRARRRRTRRSAPAGTKTLQSGTFRARAADCAASPRPTPPRLRTRIGLRMPRLSDRRARPPTPRACRRGRRS